jgi:hypothetical protein
MNLPRRQFLRLAAGAAVSPTFSRLASAQAYPARPVRLVVGFAAGSSTDILARPFHYRTLSRLDQDSFDSDVRRLDERPPFLDLRFAVRGVSRNKRSTAAPRVERY